MSVFAELSPPYSTIVADPPWHYGSWPVGRAPLGVEHDGRRKALPYSSMTLAEIAALPVREVAASDSHLWLWTTNRYLFDAKVIAEAWGFRYSQLVVWAKTPMGLGPGGVCAQNAEYVLFCRRGSLAPLSRQESVWFNWKRTAEHSVKPPGFLDLVEQVSPGPYVELFARQPRLGWDSWGYGYERKVAS
jgi:N6-adenosine-specific RNA methylase IME4